MNLYVGYRAHVTDYKVGRTFSLTFKNSITADSLPCPPPHNSYQSLTMIGEATNKNRMQVEF